jgi:methyltransferase FkbM-like protein
MQQVGCSEIDMLKLDVERVEYEVLDDMLKSDIKVRQLLVEYHHRFPQVGIERTNQSIAKLCANGFRLFNVSESGDEYSFLQSIHL